jgi:hypothetical protein
VTGLTLGCLLAVSAGAVAAHLLAWRYVAVMVAGAIYRLRAEGARRKTLTDLVTRAPANTVVFIDKGPGGPAMWVKVGDGGQAPPRVEVWRGR